MIAEGRRPALAFFPLPWPNPELSPPTATTVSPANKKQQDRTPPPPKTPQGGDAPVLSEAEEPAQYLSALPFLPPLTDKTLNTYYTFYAGCAVWMFAVLLMSACVLSCVCTSVCE
jgi:hypothetical protein